MTHKPETVEALLQALADGRGLVSICREEGMPARSTVYRWLEEDLAFRDRYARARETQADTLFDEIVEIADAEPDVNRARLRVDARKWVAGKLKPKVYGERLDVAHSGGITVNLLDHYSDPE